MKLSESGKLFYQEYDLILEAKSELEKYMTEVIIKSKAILKEFVDEKAEEIPYKLELHEFKNDNEQGRAAIQISVHPGDQSDASGDIRIICFDIRHSAYHSINQVPATIKVWTAMSNKQIIMELNRVANKECGEKIYGTEDLQLPMNFSEEDAQIVADAIIKKFEKVRALLLILKDQF